MKSLLCLVAAAALSLSPVAFATDSAANDNLGLPSSAFLLTAEESSEVRGTAWRVYNDIRKSFKQANCSKSQNADSYTCVTLKRLRGEARVVWRDTVDIDNEEGTEASANARSSSY